MVMGVKAPIGWLAIAGLALASSGTVVSAQRSERLRRLMDGEEVYRAYCSTCHGVDGRGQGPTAAALSTPPADLTLISVRNGGAFPHDRIVRFVTNGDPSRPMHGNKDMPVWGPNLALAPGADRPLSQRIDDVVWYLESLQDRQSEVRSKK
jgi:mono/diheme cytochrome c family protein